MKSVISKDGTRISYVQKGSGPALILVGGALQTKEDQLFAKLIDILAKDFSVISYDRRGRGDSGDTTPYAVAREVEDLAALTKIQKGPFCIFGNSSGAHLALKFAVANSEIKKVAVYEAPFISDEQLGSSSAYKAVLQHALTKGETGKLLQAFFARIGVPRFAVLIMKLMPMWKGLKKLAPTLIYDAELVGDGSVPSEFKSVQAATLIMSGSSDRMMSAAHSVAAVIPNSTVKVLKGQSHAVNPAVLSEELLSFFAGIS
jgi:pimeloyl-ACP methyl ester carboxylesterase